MTILSVYALVNYAKPIHHQGEWNLVFISLEKGISLHHVLEENKSYLLLALSKHHKKNINTVVKLESDKIKYTIAEGLKIKINWLELCCIQSLTFAHGAFSIKIN